MTIRNLEHCLRPRSVAVIGASGEPGSVGHTLTQNMLKSGFQGPIYLVNPHHGTIDGHECFKSVAALPEAPELAVIATPPDTVPELIGELGKKGTRAAVVITAGFSAGLKQAMLDQAQPYCLRIIGPNCLGISVAEIGLSANFGLNHPKGGKLAFLSQSGALMTGVLDWAEARDIGFSYVVSMGDMALSGDVLAGNERMLDMCRSLGFEITADPEDLSLRKVKLKLPARLQDAA